MGLLKRLFGQNRPPVLRYHELNDGSKVGSVTAWFVLNDAIVKDINSTVVQKAFSNGYRPLLKTEDEFLKRDGAMQLAISKDNVVHWLAFKVSFDMAGRSGKSKEEFLSFLDRCDAIEGKSIEEAFRIVTSNGLAITDIQSLEKIESIKDENQKEQVLQMFCEAIVVGAEKRIAAWIYHDIFNEWYQIPEKR